MQRNSLCSGNSVPAVRLVLTNDDGPASPLLVPFAECLAGRPWCRRLDVVVPAEEQSWIAQAVTRFRPLFVREHAFGNAPGFVVSGTPADCANLASQNLLPAPPELVVSGINMGCNAGLAFFLSSGTIGGSAGSWLTGIPAVAVSVDLPHETFVRWSRHDPELATDLAAEWHRTSEVAAGVIKRLLAARAWRFADIFSINIPWNATISTPVVLTRLKRTFFKGVFSQIGENVFRHKFAGLDEIAALAVYRSSDAPGDLDELSAGRISVTPIHYDLSWIDAELATAFQDSENS